MPEFTESSSLNEKISSVFGTLAIDKRRPFMSQLHKRGIPAYVAEWVMESVVPGEGPLTPEEAHRVQEWAAKFIPGPGDQNVLKHRISQGETVKVLTPLQAEVDFTRKNKPQHFAKMSLLGIDDALISNELLNKHPDLLRQGLWGVTEITQTSDGPAVMNFRPMQATVNLELFKQARREFTLSEWRSVILTTMGYVSSAFSSEEQTLLLCRLLPLVEKHMHIMELAPKGTGKSYLFENISPKVRLVSGGSVSPAVLFVNNSSGHWGLLARFSVVVLDEVQTLRFEKPDEIIGGLKGYLANNKITRGGLHESASDCGLVLLANISLDEEQSPLKEIIVEELPAFLQETAFLDRMKGIIPGWKLPKLSSKLLVGMDTDNPMGIKSDFFGDVLLALRDDFSANQFCAKHITLRGERPYRRNEESIRAIAAGLIKIQFPHSEPSPEEFARYCLKPAITLRQLVWDQLYTLDGEYRQYEKKIAIA